MFLLEKIFIVAVLVFSLACFFIAWGCSDKKDGKSSGVSATVKEVPYCTGSEPEEQQGKICRIFDERPVKDSSYRKGDLRRYADPEFVRKADSIACSLPGAVGSGCSPWLGKK